MPFEGLNISLGNIASLGQTTPQFADPDIKFGNFIFPSQFIPCTEKVTSVDIINNGDAHAQCIMAYSIAGHTQEGTVIPLSDPFPLAAGETITGEITSHFTPEYWTQTENILITFYLGFLIDAETMSITDSKEFSTEIYVEGGNGPVVKCEDNLIQSACVYPCHWYQKFLWEDEKCHTNEQDMLIDYLPFIAAGVGGVVIIIAIASKR